MAGHRCKQRLCHLHPGSLVPLGQTRACEHVQTPPGRSGTKSCYSPATALHPSPFVSGGRFWLWGVYVQLFLSIASTSTCIACEFRFPVCTYKFQLLRQPQALSTIAALNAQPSHTERSLKQAPASAALTAQQLPADSRALQNTHSAFPRARQPWKPSNSNPKFSPHDRNPRCKTSMSVCLRQSFATMSQPSF